MLKGFFSRQARKPSGWFGRIVATRLFDKGNKAINDTMSQLVIGHGGEAVLEIGFGCGDVVCRIADTLETARVDGIDFSDAMLAVAVKRNARHMQSGRMTLKHGDFDTVVYPSSSYDSVCSANTIYFWPDLPSSCARIHDVLKPGGIVVLAFVDKRKMDSLPLDMDVFTAVSSESVVELLEKVGFDGVEAHPVEGKEDAYCVVGHK